jgi:hypothetical protein
MELVVVERTFEQHCAFEDIHALDGSGSWCLSAHRVRFLKTLFSRDRLRMLCLYEAPDAEAVRLAEGEARATFDRAWTCAQLRIGSPGKPRRQNMSCRAAVLNGRKILCSIYARKAGAWTFTRQNTSRLPRADGLRRSAFSSADAESVRQ